MAPVPSPAPLHPGFGHAKNAWKLTENVMNWFSKLVTTAYTWTDLIIKNRQKKVDDEYNIKKAEEKALEIMKDQDKKKRNLRRRGVPVLEDRVVEDLIEEMGGIEEFSQFLESFLDEYE
jgi:hypothetical protein